VGPTSPFGSGGHPDPLLTRLRPSKLAVGEGAGASGPAPRPEPIGAPWPLSGGGFAGSSGSGRSRGFGLYPGGFCRSPRQGFALWSLIAVGLPWTAGEALTGPEPFAEPGPEPTVTARETARAAAIFTFGPIQIFCTPSHKVDQPLGSSESSAPRRTSHSFVDLLDKYGR